MAKLSIITGTGDRPDSFARFMRSAYKAQDVDTEIIVGQFGAEPFYALDYKQLCAVRSIDVAIERERAGMIHGYNAGFRRSTGEFVAWFNDDCELTPGWDTAAIAFMEAHPEIGVGCIYFRDHLGKQWGTCWQIQSLYGIFYPNFGILRREVGERLGWFSEDIGPMYGVDSDLGNKALDIGLGVVGIDDSRVLHHRVRDDQRLHNISDIHKYRELFDAKWKHKTEGLKFEQAKYAYLSGPKTILIPSGE